MMLMVLVMSAAMRTHMNILQEEMIWTSRQNDYSECDITIILSIEGVLLCEWPEPALMHYETSVEAQDCSFEKDTPASVHDLTHSIGGH